MSQCNHPTCDRAADRGCLGWCKAHYERNRTGRDMDRPLPPRGAVADRCSVPGCDGESTRGYRGWCRAHHERNRKGKDMDPPINRMVPRSATLKERLLFRTDVRGPDECWEWQGYRRKDRGKTVTNVGTYGTMTLPGGKADQCVHVVSYEVHHGPVPPGLEVRHSCNNPGCVNPAHLSVGTRQDNRLDCVRAGRNYSYFRDGPV